MCQNSKDLPNIRSECIHNKNENAKEKHRELFFCYENSSLHPAWRVPPIDMTPKLYFVNKKSTKRPSLQKTLDKEGSKSFQLPRLQNLTNSSMDGIEKPKGDMLLRFRIDSANSDRRKTLHTGFHKKGKYSQPRPHHFRDDIHRPLDNVIKLEKEDFKVEFDHDPFDINFKNFTLKHLMIPELSSTSKDNVMRSSRDKKMITFKAKEKNFDTKLLLPKTKYQKGRDPQEVLYDKIVQSKKLPCGNKEFELLRPDIYDNTTTDLLEITRSGPRHQCLELT